MRQWIVVIALAASACTRTQPNYPAAPTNAGAPPPLARATYARSDGEIPVENVEGALSGGDYDRGLAALQGGDLESAQAAYQRIHDRDPKEGAGFLLLAMIREKQGDRPGAESAYRDAIRLRADLEAGYLGLSALLAFEKRAPEALAVARAGLARRPSSARLHANAATALAALDDQVGATGELEEAARAAPDDPALLLSFGHWLRVWKEDDAALGKLRTARALARDSGLLAAIGEEMRALGAFSDCVPTFDQALRLDNAPKLRTYRAVCKLGAKDTEGAKADLQAAIDAQYTPAHFYLARLLSDTGDWTGAVAEYETFLKLEPNVPAARVAREKLKQARERAKRLTMVR